MNKLLKPAVVATIVATTSLTVGLETLRAEPESAVIEQYVGSSKLPDWIAFQFFLNLVEGQVGYPEMAAHYMVKALDLDMNTVEGASKIDYYHSWFVAMQAEIHREFTAETNRILCSGDWASMSHEEIQSGMDEKEASRERIYEEHFALTLEELSAEERTAFLAHIENVKKSSSWVNLDNNILWGEKAEENVRRIQAYTCSKVSTTGQ